jgi:Flp pilus assembly protein TadG
MRSMIHARRTGLSQRPRRNRQGGGAAVEFALVLPIFCAIVFGLIDYGWYFYQRFSLAAAVRDGLRLGVTVNQSVAYPNDCATMAITRATSDLIASGMPVPTGTFTTSTAGSSPSKTLTLTAKYTYAPLVNFVRLPTGQMNYSMTMMFEQQQ